MPLTLALAQCAHPSDGDVVGLVRSWARDAKARGAQLLVFPECLMTPFESTPDQFAAAAEPLDGPFTCAVDAVARELGLWLAYTVNEHNPRGGRPFNTLVLTDGDGARRAAYRKVHLFDVGKFRESDKMSPGDALPKPVPTPFGAVGLGICYDLRFPELARAQALAGCELMLYPAAWVDGPGKREQWRTLLQARAIENGMFVAGLCRAGSLYVGSSLVVGPRGEVVASAGEGEELLCCTVDLDEVAAARAAVPSLSHRRVDLY